MIATKPGPDAIRVGTWAEARCAGREIEHGVARRSPSCSPSDRVGFARQAERIT